MGVGAVCSKRVSKVFDVHTRIKNYNLLRQLNGVLPRDEAEEKATEYASIRVEASTIQEAIEVFYTVYSRYGLDKEYKVTGVVEVTEIDITYSDYLAKKKSMEDKQTIGDAPNCGTPVTPKKD